MRRSLAGTRSYGSTSALPFAVALALAWLLAACAMPSHALDPDEAAASQAALASIDLAFASAASDDDRDLAPDDLGADRASVADAAAIGPAEPRLVLRRVGMQRYRELDAVRVDRSAEPPSAVVDLTVGVRGEAHLWQVWTRPEPQRTLAGTKRIDVRGPVRLHLEHLDGAWRLVAARHGALTQGPRAADVTAWSTEPDPYLAGERGRVTLTLGAPRPDDAFAVGARGPVLAALGPLQEVGEGRYAAEGVVPPRAPVGRSMAFLTALNVTATFDLSTAEDGSFRSPYTETILPVVVRVAPHE